MLVWRRGEQAEHTGESHLREDEQVQVLYVRWVHAIEDGIGAVEVVVHIAHLGSELETADPHPAGSELGSQALRLVKGGS